jgi:hypothetical protein
MPEKLYFARLFERLWGFLKDENTKIRIKCEKS